MALKVIALTGPKGSGKDTIALLMKEMSSVPVQTIAFADPIKKSIQHIFQLDDANNDEYDRFKRSELTAASSFRDKDITTSWKNVEARHVVREIGMLMRQYDEHQFERYVDQTIASDTEKIWIVTDLRFDNEYMMLKRLRARIVKIIRPNYEYDGHITERAFDDHLVDKILMNDGDLTHLKYRTEVVFNSIMKEWE